VETIQLIKNIFILLTQTKDKKIEHG